MQSLAACWTKISSCSTSGRIFDELSSIGQKYDALSLIGYEILFEAHLMTMSIFYRIQTTPLHRSLLIWIKSDIDIWKLLSFFMKWFLWITFPNAKLITSNEVNFFIFILSFKIFDERAKRFQLTLELYHLHWLMNFDL